MRYNSYSTPEQEIIPGSWSEESKIEAQAERWAVALWRSSL